MTTKYIPISKAKFARNIFLCLCFVLTSIWLITMAPDPDNPLFSEAIRIFCGTMGLVVFGTFFVLYIYILFTKKLGLTISSEGITEHSTAASVGFIPWEEISFFVTVRRVGQVFIVPKLNDPEKYISRGNFLERYILRSNFRQNGSPVAITPSLLETTPNELMALLEEGLDTYEQNNPSKQCNNFR